jgi:nucleoside-diphosphate-sugar epimerase
VRIGKTIAVTGASGFIGQHVCSDLLRQGYSVRALTRDPSRMEPGVQAYLTPDLRRVELLRPGLRGVDSVIHLAGHAHVMSGIGGDAEFRAVNIEGTRAVAEAAAAESVRQLIFSSSVKAMGEGGNAPVSDESAENPHDSYGRSKLEAEHGLSEIGDREGLAVTILRFPLVYGPGVKGNLRRLFDAVWRGFPIPVGDVHNARTMLGVGNIVAFISRLLEEPLASRRPYLLSDSETVSTDTLVRMIGKDLKRRPRIVKVPLGFLRGLAAVGDIVARTGVPALTNAHVDRLAGSLIVDSSRAWREARMSPPVSLEAGVARTAEWYLSQVIR